MKCYSYIRFSTPEQLKGDSLRRQLELSEKYAIEHDLELDKSLTFKDLGLSAFHGHHKTKGNLGLFLKAVEEGRIEKGSVLLVESLDRLSREQILDALNQFTAIINNDIKIVTLIDNKEYSKDSINSNFTDLIISIVIMSRAYEESLIKSKRGKETWANKRNKLEKKITAKAPEWLELSENRTEFKPIKDRSETIKKIFDMKLSGKGADLIARELNKNNSHWPKNGWRKSYINKILRSKAVIGEYQPHKIVKGKRVPAGEPIKNYFPAIVSEDLFYRVHNLIHQNQHSGGKTGKVSNLFTGLLECSCGGKIHYVNKGGKNWQYLTCDRARRNLGCKKVSYKYQKFEQLALKYCWDLNPKDLLPDSEEQKSIILSHKNRISAIEGRLNDLESKINNLVDSIADTDSKEIRKRLEAKLNTLLDEKNRLHEEKETISKELVEISKKGDFTGRLDSIKELLKHIYSLEEKERIDLRLKLRMLIKDFIEKIVICGRETYPKEKINLDKVNNEKLKKFLSTNRSYDKYIFFFKNGKGFTLLTNEKKEVNNLQHPDDGNNMPKNRANYLQEINAWAARIWQDHARKKTPDHIACS